MSPHANAILYEYQNMDEKLSFSSTELARELGMPESDVNEIMSGTERATFASPATLDTLKAEISGQRTEADKRLALQRARSEKRVSIGAVAITNDAAGAAASERSRFER
ncbi:MAG TPA: hypothetical protein PK765_05180 [bacterium]|nr:hypothetical protein [bacterium]